MTTADLQALRLTYREREIQRLTYPCPRCGATCTGPHPKPSEGSEP